ncbi:MAG: hypothetical protein ACWA6Y_01160 [Polaromonas sp.]
MTTPSNELTPQERLAISRKAILRHMNRLHPPDLARDSNEDDDALNQDQAIGHSPQSKLSLIKHAMQIWWHRHPASMAVELSRPVLNEYARTHPFQLLGLSAGAGAALVVLRPWRLISAGALLGTALKSSGLSSALVSMLASVNRSHESSS